MAKRAEYEQTVGRLLIPGQGIRCYNCFFCLISLDGWNSSDCDFLHVLQTLYAICDIAILIAKDIAQLKKKLVETYPGAIPLPASLYKVPEAKARSKKTPVAKAADAKVAETKASEPKTTEQKLLVSKEAELNGSKAAEPNESEAVDENASEVRAVETIESKVAAEPNEPKGPELDALMDEANETMPLESKEPKAPDADESMVPGPNDTASNAAASGEAIPPVGGDEKSAVIEEEELEDEPEDEPAKVCLLPL